MKGGNVARDFKYSAFISYSHADKNIVQWLHRALEGYRLPGHLAGKDTPDGVIPRKLKPFFRDRDDLSAATSLTKSVRASLKQSEFLIVICSPDAAKSEWVNKEILGFKELRGENNILCLIVGGEPNASKKSHGKDNECFPPALRKLTGKKTFEPIAADARPEGDGKRLAKLKLIAGLLGIELDKLVQRDAQRQQRRQAAILGSSLLGIVVLSVLLVFAIEARKDADEKRAQAENLVEFMISDLREKLEPAGNLQAMDSIAKRAMQYYASLDPEELDEVSLGSRSRVLLMIGGIEDARGNLDQAAEVFTEAFKTTEELLSRNPENPGRIFDHSQSLYWLGYLDWRRGELDKAEEGFQGYAEFAKRLVEIDPDNVDWQTESGYAHSNLGTLYYSRGKYAEAEKEFEASLKIFMALTRQVPDSIDLQYELAQSYAWQADAKQGLGDMKGAQLQRLSEKSIYENILARDQSYNFVKSSLLVTYRKLGVLAINQGNVDAALAEYKSGLKMGNELLALGPDNTQWTFQTVSLYLDYAEVNMATGNLGEANQSLKQVKSLVDFLTSRGASVLEWKINSSLRWQLLSAALYQKEDNFQGALELATSVSDTLYLEREQNPNNRDILNRLIESLYIMGESYRKMEKTELKKGVLEKIVDLVEKNEKEAGLRAQFLLAKAYLELGFKDKAQQKALYLDDLGYLNPEYILFRKKFFEN